MAEPDLLTNYTVLCYEMGGMPPEFCHFELSEECTKLREEHLGDPWSSPGKWTMKEFIDYTKANPGKVNMASNGNGSSTHCTL